MYSGLDSRWSTSIGCYSVVALYSSVGCVVLHLKLGNAALIRPKVCVELLDLNALSDEVIVHFDMLRACVEHLVPSQMNIAHVVAVYRAFNIILYLVDPHVAHRFLLW